MKICLAVGDVSVEEWIKDKIGERCSFTKDCSYRQMVIPILNQDVPDILILSESLIGKDGEQGISIFDLTEEIRRTLPSIRIIFIANEHDYESPEDTLLDSIAKLGIYDILCSNPRKNEPLMIKDVIKMIVKPSDYSYAAKYMHLVRDDLGKESSKEVAIIDEIPKKSKKSSIDKGDRLPGIKTISKISVEKVTESSTPKPEIIVQTNKETKQDKLDEIEDSTTVLCSGNNELIFRPAMPTDFDKFFDAEHLPGPDSFDGAYRRKNILYSNINPYKPIPQKARVIVFCGARQGVGCTTTAINVAVSLSLEWDKKILMVDASYENALFDRFAVNGGQWYGLDVIAECYRNKTGVKGRCITKNMLVASANSDRLNSLPEKLEYINLGANISEKDDIPGIADTMSELAKEYDYIVIDLDISKVNDISKTLLTIADDVICVTTPDAYEINKLLESIIKFKQHINLEGKYKAVINRYVGTSLDIGYISKTLNTGTLYVIKDSRSYAHNSINWLPIYLGIPKRKIRQPYLKIAEGVINNSS